MSSQSRDARLKRICEKTRFAEEKGPISHFVSIILVISKGEISGMSKNSLENFPSFQWFCYVKSLKSMVKTAVLGEVKRKK